MNLLRFTALLGFAAGVAIARAQTAERELNLWPAMVAQRDSWTGAGPLLFSRLAPEDAGRQSGLRPVWVQTRDAQGDFRSALFLYPIFSYSTTAETYKWTVLNLINGSGRRAGAPARQSALE